MRRVQDRPVDAAWVHAQLLKIHPPAATAPLCLAFSGGADSTALLGLLAAIPDLASRLRAVHLDHGLQADSAHWARTCRATCRALGIPLSVRRLALVRRRGESLEAVARTARYAALAATLKPGEVLLTAQHQEDQLETVLLQLLRGAGVAGVSAMPALAGFARGQLARPLLGVPRQALAEWLETEGLTWVEDPSNQDLALDRNYLRARILPALTGRWPAAAATVGRAARHAAQAQQLLDELGEADLARARVGAALSARVLRALSPARRSNALRTWISEAGVRVPPAARLAEIAGPLLAARADTQPVVSWEGASVKRESQLLWLRSAASAAPAARQESVQGEAVAWRWKARRTLKLAQPPGTLTLRADARGPLDLGALGPLLHLRVRRGGERLRPVKGGARRALKGLLQEARVPVEVRGSLPLLYDGERLIGVAGLWLDESVQATPQSRRRGRLIWSPQ